MTGLKITIQACDLNTQQQGIGTKTPVFTSISDELPVTYIITNDDFRGMSIQTLKACIIVAMKGKASAALINDVTNDPLNTMISTAYTDLVNPIV